MLGHIRLQPIRAVVRFDPRTGAKVTKRVEAVLGSFPDALFSLLQLHDFEVDARFDLHQPEVPGHDVALILNRSSAGGKNEVQSARGAARSPGRQSVVDRLWKWNRPRPGLRLPA
jgi:hypothetical protein